jgi:hypothetical protein
MDEIFSFLNPKEFKNNWPTKEGFIFYLVFTFCFWLTLVGLFNSTFSKNALNLEQATVSLVILLLIHILSWFVYFFIKKILPIKKNKINIALSIKYDEKGKEISLKTIEKFKKKFREIKTHNHFNIFDIHKSVSFLNDKEAEIYAKKEGITLLIWGYTDHGNIEGIETTIFNLKFSYCFASFGKSQEEFLKSRENFSRNISNALEKRLWKISKPNNLPELSIVSENISEVTLFIVIKVLISLSYWKLALGFCDELLQMLKNIPNRNAFPKFNIFQSIVKTTSADLSNSISYYFISRKEDFHKAKHYASKALTYINDYFPALINMASLSESEGKTDVAKKFNQLANKKEPGNNLVRLNKAFFALKEKKYKLAVSAYKKIKKIPNGSNVFDTTTFLYSYFEKTKEPSYLFGSGILNYRFGDKTTGKIELKKFLNLVKNHQEKYKPLIGYISGVLIS